MFIIYFTSSSVYECTKAQKLHRFCNPLASPAIGDLPRWKEGLLVSNSDHDCHDALGVRMRTKAIFHPGMPLQEPWKFDHKRARSEKNIPGLLSSSSVAKDIIFIAFGCHGLALQGWVFDECFLGGYLP
jgi:hypothetical protein